MLRVGRRIGARLSVGGKTDAGFAVISTMVGEEDIFDCTMVGEEDMFDCTMVGEEDTVGSAVMVGTSDTVGDSVFEVLGVSDNEGRALGAGDMLGAGVIPGVSVGDLDGADDEFKVGAIEAATVGEIEAATVGETVGSLVNSSPERHTFESSNPGKQSVIHWPVPTKQPPELSDSTANLFGPPAHPFEVSSSSTKLSIAMKFSPPEPTKATRSLVFPKKQPCRRPNSPPRRVTMLLCISRTLDKYMLVQQ
jgi:hypothetical protein